MSTVCVPVVELSDFGSYLCCRLWGPSWCQPGVSEWLMSCLTLAAASAVVFEVLTDVNLVCPNGWAVWLWLLPLLSSLRASLMSTVCVRVVGLSDFGCYLGWRLWGPSWCQPGVSQWLMSCLTLAATSAGLSSLKAWLMSTRCVRVVGLSDFGCYIGCRLWGPSWCHLCPSLWAVWRSRFFKMVWFYFEKHGAYIIYTRYDYDDVYSNGYFDIPASFPFNRPLAQRARSLDLKAVL